MMFLIFYICFSSLVLLGSGLLKLQAHGVLDFSSFIAALFLSILTGWYLLPIRIGQKLLN